MLHLDNVTLKYGLPRVRALLPLDLLIYESCPLEESASHHETSNKLDFKKSNITIFKTFDGHVRMCQLQRSYWTWKDTIGIYVENNENRCPEL